MFGKSRRDQKEIKTLLGTGTRVVGHLSFEGGLHVDGSVEGNISAPPGVEAAVSISSTGTVEGNVEAPEVVLNGTVKGDVFASERVELGSTARVVGNVVYNLIEMAIGAEVNGKLIHRPAGRAEAETPQDPDSASS
ncbi:MAG: polymer-forming cytoskeletal protein [Gammaproteobacteria bacterium]|jgi:cytoskeletal protein CcmA (bactofilin family)